MEDLSYRVAFGAADADGRQDAGQDSATGELVLEGRTGEPATGPGVRLWAGRIADSFYIDLSLLAMVNSAVRGGTALDLSGWRPGTAQNSFAGTTVDSIVLEVSHRHPRLRPGARIGVWCATKLATDSGGWRQVNRAGHPMMWPIFWPDDTQFTNPANTRHPSEDLAADGKHIGDLVAATARRATPRATAGPCGPRRSVRRAGLTVGGHRSPMSGRSTVDNKKGKESDLLATSNV